jgi:hypothetical protein
MHARAKRKRSWAAVLTRKTEDTLAGLRGAVNGGAEEKRIVSFLKGVFRIIFLLSASFFSH